MPILASYVGIGTSPRLETAVAESLREIRLTFDEDLANNAALVDVDNYTLIPQGDSVPRSVLTAVRASATEILLTADGDLTVGDDAYEVLVETVSDLAGNAIDPAYDTLLFSVPPHVSEIEDHCTRALARRLAQYRGTPNFEALICLLGDALTTVEQMFQDLLAFRSIETAYGAQLDAVGSKVGVAREGLTDAIYRIRIRARAAAIGSRGTPDEIFAILGILIDGTDVFRYLDESFPAGAVIEAFPLELMEGEAFAKILQDATPAAVHLVFLHDGGFHLFGWDEDPTTFPWAEDEDDVDGGIWAEAT